MVEDSVRAHLVADVPVSSFLSGGLDSSIVTVLAKQANPQIDAYTITFRAEDNRLEAMPDDAVYARKVAQRHGIDLHEIEIQPDVVGLLPRMVDILDEPIGDPAAINTLLMSEAARAAGVKVLLSGMGADELFGGYRKHVACMLAGRYRDLPGFVHRSTNGVVERLPLTAAGRGLRYARWAKRFVTFAELPEEAAFRRSYSLYAPDELAAFLSPELQRRRRRLSLSNICRSTRTITCRTGSTACVWPIPECSSPGSTSPTRTGPAWLHRPKCAFRSWIPRSFGPRSHSRARTRSPAEPERSH